MWQPSVVCARSRPNSHEDIEMAGNPILQQEEDATAPQNPTSQQQGNAPSLQGRDLAINELFGLQNRENRNKYPGVDHFFAM